MRMKKSVGLLLTVLLAASLLLSACGNGGAGGSVGGGYVGTWRLSKVRVGVLTMDMDTIEAMTDEVYNFVYVLEPGGTLYGGNTNDTNDVPHDHTGTWAASEDGVVMTIDKVDITFYDEDGALVLNLSSYPGELFEGLESLDDSVKMIFEKV